jgi:hypothetical protein
VVNQAIRYSFIEQKEIREIILLKSRPCFWGKCTFCDYILDNSVSLEEIDRINSSIIKQVQGVSGTLEIINSGSCFELTDKTIKMIKDCVKAREIKKLWFESHWNYRKKFANFKKQFGSDVQVLFKVGVETFNAPFREKILKKGASDLTIDEAVKFCDAVCIMVGIKGQTREMISEDIDIISKKFKKACINVFVENSCSLKADPELIAWFKEKYQYLEKNQNIDILFDNKDFGVWGPQ